MPEARLLNLLDIYAEDSVKICADLVRLPSEDPPGDTRAVAGYIHELFRGKGISSELIAPEADKPNVVATIHGARSGPHIVYNGHIDTYPVGERSRWNYDPFGATVEGGRMYGRGTCDMKGGLSASIAAFLALNEIRDELPGQVSITCVSDEEVYGPWGSRYILENRPEFRGDALINGEPSSLEHIRIGEKGRYICKIETWTGGGHGAYVRLRRSAVEEMFEILSKLRVFESRAFEMPEDVRAVMNDARESYDRILGAGTMGAALVPSMNIGTVSGGIMANMVPEHCEASLDFRLPPGLSGRDVRSLIDEIFKEYPSARLEEIASEDPCLTSPGHLLIEIAGRSAAEVCGMPVFKNYSMGAAEAYLWRSRGIPAVVYGPHHHNMASPDEYVVVDELPKVARVHALVACRYLAESGRP